MYSRPMTTNAAPDLGAFSISLPVQDLEASRAVFKYDPDCEARQVLAAAAGGAL